MTDTPTASTLHCYENDWQHWCDWCKPRGVGPFQCTATALIDCMRQWIAAGLSFSTVGRRKAAISYYHRQAGIEHAVCSDYTVRAAMSEIRRSTPAKRGKLPISKADLDRILKNCAADPTRLLGLRDRAIFAVMWSGGFTRAPLAALRVADLSGPRLRDLSDDARSAAMEWVQAARLTKGPLFRACPLGGKVGGEALRPNSIARAIKKRCATIGKARGLFSASSVCKGRISFEVQRGTPICTMLRVAGIGTIETALRAAR